MANTTRPASDSQHNYIRSLIAGRTTPDDLTAEGQAAALTAARASEIIDLLKALPYQRTIPAPRTDTTPTVTVAPRPAAQEGFYLLDGTVYTVVRGTYTPRLYAKRLVPGARGSAHWAYDNSAYKRLSDDDRLTHTEAARLGHLYGVCVRCTKGLTDIRSQSAGYGRTCARVMGWPYPTKREAEETLTAAAM